MKVRHIKQVLEFASEGVAAFFILVGTIVLVSAFMNVPLQAQWATTVDVGYGPTPTIDGAIDTGEYMGAASIQFPCYGGTCQAYVGHDTTNLYVAFDLPDTTPYPYVSQGGSGPAVQVFLDTDNDKAGSPQTDDYRLTLTKGSEGYEAQGTGSGGGTGHWRQEHPTNWTGAVITQTSGWQAEFSISFVKLGINPGSAKTLGLALANVWTKDWPVDYYWPSGGDWDEPDTWGDAYSTADWLPWSFKAGGWTDYAPNGVPDFDQKLDMWGPSPWQWTYCGPVAAANSLWWFDAKFEPSPVPPLSKDDDYYLITEYPGANGDDDPSNVGGMGILGLVDNLAWYFDTDGIRTGTAGLGTEVHSMTHGLEWFLYGDSQVYPGWSWPHMTRPWSYYDDYHVQLVKMPTWDWVVDEVQRSEDVILLLGFWHLQESGQWARLGGHYVTVAGVNAESPPKIALSDPYFDNAEGSGPGRVMTGTIHTPHDPGHPPFVHNDAGNISHDYYTVTLATPSPAGLWEIENYPYEACNPDQNFWEQNCPAEFVPDQADACTGGDLVYVEVEYALAVSPFYWKPGGEWVDTWWQEQWITEFWRYEDDGHSCLPDFLWEDSQDFYYDGPVSVANSFWWFDSKAETLLTGGWPTPPEFGTADHYSLTVAYGVWDDHDISNTVPFISDLAEHYLDTGLYGTTIASMTAGIDAYLARPGVAGDFYTDTQANPTWAWIADEVETCEDVILLLGFYEEDPGGAWQRRGGHWVNAAGVNREGMFIGLSDPAIDHAISETVSSTMYLGRVFPPEQRGTPFTKEEKRDPQSISHDIYQLTPHAGLGQLMLEGYPFTSTSVLSNFVEMNGEGNPVENWGNPLATTIEWAIGVSPHSELVITKTASVTDVLPGDQVTFVIEYANTGLAAALDVTISDTMPDGVLTNLSATSYPPISATVGSSVIWTRPRLGYGQTGTLTITAQSLVTATLTNTAYITGLNAIGTPTPDRDLSNNTATTGPDCVDLSEILITGPTSGQAGDYSFDTRYEPVNASKPIAYQWDDGGAVPTSTRFLEVGAHTLTVTASNCLDALVTDTHTIIITKATCIGTEMVELKMVSSSPIRVSNQVEFEADIAPDNAAKPYTYTTALDDQEEEPQTSSADPLAFTQTFATTGTHSVTVAVWNCTMTIAEAVTSTVEIEVLSAPPACVEIEMVGLALTPPGPIRIGSKATFEVDIAPDDAAKPYTYTLALDGLEGDPQIAGTDPLTFTYPFVTSGSHTVAVNAWNCEMTREEALSSTVQVKVIAYQVYLPIVLKDK